MNTFENLADARVAYDALAEQLLELQRSIPKKGSWGGKRPGSGRRGLDRKPVGARLRPELHAKLLDRAHSSGVSISRMIEVLLERELLADDGQ